MDGREGRKDKDELDYEARWPQRPSRGKPTGNTPPGGHEDMPPEKWASTPTTYESVAPGEDDPKETRILPVVEPSRFDNGRPAPTPASPPRAPVKNQAQAWPKRPYEPQSAPASTGQGVYDEYDEDTAQFGPGHYPMPAYEYESRAAALVKPKAAVRPKRRWIGWTL